MSEPVVHGRLGVLDVDRSRRGVRRRLCREGSEKARRGRNPLGTSS